MSFCVSFHADSELAIHYFENAGIDWLHFIAANRDKSLFQYFLKRFYNYDIIGGKVADDTTAVTLNAISPEIMESQDR